MRLVSHVTFTVSPDNIPAALDILLKEMPHVRQMKGCQAFIPFADPTVSGGMGVLHEWDTAVIWHLRASPQLTPFSVR